MMLMLTRKPGEYILIGDGIKICIAEVRGKQVKLAIDAPPKLRVLRGELVEGDKTKGQKPLTGSAGYHLE